ncbi:MAG: insulinase family protein [Oscillatoriales cyanobacterium RM1_1_9]|nr:insulinase family protein [Oscillatoriales cyanobacterium SM2_3_0]NJO47180.1 insulinase family protein [Oscillatoriales cyanobacterium RM2_1_1]NJO71886.1 insulinase family protein [Oscillatoriales cyanobacterium RM1_1_9]
MNANSKLNFRKPPQFLAVLVLVTFAVVMLGRSPAVAATPKHYDQLTFPPLPEIQLPAYTRYQLKNGITVYLMEDHELPLVGGTALFRTGSRFEPEDKVGLASLTGEVMRTGGTQTRPAEKLNQLLEQKAASVETGIGDTSGSAGFGALAEDLDEVFGLFAEVIQQPIFAEEKLNLAGTQERGSIARRNDDPNQIAGREFQKLIYGPDSPYARTTEYATLNNISRQDLIDFHQQYFQPQNMILGIVGDFDSETMKVLIADRFGDWQPDGSAQVPPLPTVSPAHQGGVFFISQPQLNQSYIQMGHLGGELDNPDYAELTVMNGVLNGFGGRLFNKVRSEKGLAYSVYGVWSARFDYPGTFVAGGQTRSDATVDFIKSVQAELKRIQEEPVQPQELAYAKDSTLNSFIFNFESPSQTLSRLMRYEYYGYPEDFIFQYRREVEATTIADIQRVAQQYLKPENLVTLVVGNDREIQPPLVSLTKPEKVISIDIAIPAEPT